MTVYIGIDQGLTGAIAFLGKGWDRVLDCPVAKARKGHDFQVPLMVDLLDSLLDEHNVGAMVAAIEQGIAMPRQSSSSTFKTGRGIGLWEMALAARGIRYEFVTPQRWKKALGIPKGADKNESRVVAQRLFPDLADQLARVKDDGRADALLIAEWRRRQG